MVIVAMIIILSPVQQSRVNSWNSVTFRFETADGKLIAARLIVFPEDSDAETVLYNHFTLLTIRNPDDQFMEPKSLCFFCVHKDLSMFQM